MEDVSIDDILRHVYELEGLVLVARKEDADRSMLLQMIKEKVACIGKMLDNGGEAAAAMPEQPTAPVQPAIDEDESMPGAAAAEGNPVPAPEADTTEEAPILTDAGDSDDWDGSRHDSPEEPAAEMTFDYEEPQKITDSSDGEPALPPQQEDEKTPEAEYHVGGDDEGGEEEQVTVDDLLQRNMSRDLKRAFTINDRFRYRRELFGNSDVEMNDAISLVEAMQSYAEAEEYFYDMLNWDRESPEVADFMAIIRNHFYAK